MNIDNNNDQINLIDNIKQDKIGLCGLKNMGNTCYMNSILQLLIHSQTMINFLLCETNPYIIDGEENSSFVDLIITFPDIILFSKIIICSE